MINLKIGASERRFNNTGDIDESWINQQINGLKRDGQLSCIRLSINEGSVNLSLATIDYASSGGRTDHQIEMKAEFLIFGGNWV